MLDLQVDMTIRKTTPADIDAEAIRHRANPWTTTDTTPDGDAWSTIKATARAALVDMLEEGERQ